MAKRIINKQQRIKAAALALFAQHGYHGTSTEMIIAKAGVSKGLLFFHFKNKNELLKVLQHEWMEKLWATIIPIKNEALSPLKCLEEFLNKIQQTLTDNESEYRMHYSMLLIGNPLSSEAELQQLAGYAKLYDYLQWLFKRLKIKDINSEIAFFSAVVLGAEMRFLILNEGQVEHFKVIKRVLMERYK